MNAISFYRISNKLYNRKIPILPSIIHKIIFLLFNSHIPFTAKIGKGTRFAYGGIGVVLHSDSVIGENCIIGTNVTIGGGSGPGVPVIGNSVYISTGAKVIGNVTVGDRSIIGVNAVVVKNVPQKCVAAGVPAKIIKEGIEISEFCNIK